MYSGIFLLFLNNGSLQKKKKTLHEKYTTGYQRATLKCKPEKSGNVLFVPANMQMVRAEKNKKR